ncbi:MAG: hypothetical protein WC045_04030 [Patescibacteria group bacterium]
MGYKEPAGRKIARISKNATQSIVLAGADIAMSFFTSPDPSTAVNISFAKAVQGAIGVYQEIKQGEAYEFVDFIKNHKKVFVQNIVATKAFQDGVVVTIEAYIRQRVVEKRFIIQQVFLGFTDSQDKGVFELERFYSAVNNISLGSVEYLVHAVRDILPVLESDLREQAGRSHEGNGHTIEHEMDLWRDNAIFSLSRYSDKWIEDNFGSQSSVVRKRHNYDGADNEILRKILDERSPYVVRAQEALAELVSLGICRIVNEGGAGGFGAGVPSISVALTDFGRRFIHYTSSAQELLSTYKINIKNEAVAP